MPRARPRSGSRSHRRSPVRAVLRGSWLAASAVLWAVGMTEAARRYGVPLVVMVFITTAVVVVALERAMLPEGRWDHRRSLRHAPLAAGLVVVLLGLVSLWHVGGLGLTLLLGVGSPPALAALDARQRRENPPRVLPPEASAASLTGAEVEGPRVISGVTRAFDVPDVLDAEDLCRAWTSSFLALERAASASDRLRIVQFRATCLDLLEWNSPTGFSRWMASGARAASDPRRFLRPGAAA